jgi:hypothetical protein
MRDLLFEGIRGELEKIWKPSWEYFDDAADFELVLEDVANAFNAAVERSYGLQLSMA